MPVTSQATSVLIAVTVGSPGQVITAGLIQTDIPAAAAGWLVKTVTKTICQEQTIYTTDLDTTLSKINSPVLYKFFSLKHFNVSVYMSFSYVCFLLQLVAEQPKATDAKGGSDEENVSTETRRVKLTEF